MTKTMRDHLTPVRIALIRLSTVLKLLILAI
jgi:hypothetical protein